MDTLPRSFEIHWARQYLVKFVGLAGIVNASVNKTKPIFKAVPGKIHLSGGHNKRNCSQDQANFHMSRAWQIVLILNTDIAWP